MLDEKLPSDRLAYTPEQACEVIPCCSSTLYKIIRTGVLDVRRLGKKRTLSTAASLRAYIEKPQSRIRDIWQDKPDLAPTQRGRGYKRSPEARAKMSAAAYARARAKRRSKKLAARKRRQTKKGRAIKPGPKSITDGKNWRKTMVSNPPRYANEGRSPWLIIQTIIVQIKLIISRAELTASTGR